MKKLTITALLIFFTFSCNADKKKFQDGDIIFHTSRSAQSQAIQIATNSKYSHVGIIFFINDKPYVFEAIKTVIFTPLDEWIARGVDSKYVVKRLKKADLLLTDDIKKKLIKEAEKYKGKPYDLYFEWSNEKIYCSELVWKMYKTTLNKNIGKLQKLKEFNINHPVVIKKMKERYGNKIPLDEIVISPASVFESEELITVKKL